jgi:cytoskeletal protein CcmA (bactofilin family)
MEERRKSCWISGAITVKGNVTSAGDLVIDGRVEGALEIGNHNLTIGETATVVADLMARDVTIAGTVQGNVLGSGKVELKKNSAVEGDITTPRFVMEEGAVLSGKVDTGDRK